MSARNPLAAAVLAMLAPAVISAQTPASDIPLRLPVSPAFRVTVGFAHAGWSDDALSGANGVALTVSRHVFGPVRGLFDFATLSGNTLSGSGAEAARHYLAGAGVSVAPELTAGGLVVRPELGAAIGTWVSDPAADSSSTRSQNAWEVFIGVDANVYGPLTLGLRYRRVPMRMQDVAAQGPTVPSIALRAQVFEVGLGVRF